MKKQIKGFTLIEIMIVIIIIGIIAAAAIPRYSTVVEKFRSQEGRDTLLTIYAAEKRYHADVGTYTTMPFVSGQLDIGNSLDLKHFDQPQLLTVGNALGTAPCSSSQEWIATIERSNGPEYRLCVNKDGEIFCKGDGCAHLGFDEI